MASRKKKKKKQQRAQRKQPAPQPRDEPQAQASPRDDAESRAEDASAEDASAPDTSAKAPAAERRGRSRWITVLIVVVVGGAAAAYLLTRGPTVVQVKNAAGAMDRCPTCHRFDKKPHPAVAGHRKGKDKLALASIGCTPCHGGDGSATDSNKAHAPPVASGARALLPRRFTTSGCAGCHIIGDRATKKLAAGQKLYLETGCVGCHYPGRRTPGVGPDLRKATMPSATKLQKLLLAPPSKNTMWSLTDLTYRGRFTESGAALAALMRYTLSIASTPAPLQAHWASPKVSAALAACDGCHATRPAKGDKHRCPQLSAKSAALRCARCHGGDKTPAKASISKCPSVRAAAPLCKTCHLRDQ